MGSKKTSTTIAQASPAQKKMEQLLLAQAQKAYGQMGDLSALASGQGGQMTPEMEAQLQGAYAASQGNIQQQYLDALRQQGTTASTRGIGGSSAEAIGMALLGQTRNQELAGIESQMSQQRLQLPFQMGQQQLSANQLLAQIASGSVNPALQSQLSQQLAQTDTKQTGGAFETALGLGQAFAGGGAFGSGGILGKGK